TEEEARSQLQQEFELMIHSNAFKMEFDAWEKECELEVTIPKFCWNFENAVFGKFRDENGNANLPYRHFIATPLLPCGAADGGLQKVMGNDTFGTPETNVEKAVHAFVHFVWIVSKGHFLFCDLQGLYDQSRVLRLFDPQCHTYVEHVL
ncbi:hypothetical protein OBBRIDRAFT_699572, partial [Obba rivulosa]